VAVIAALAVTLGSALLGLTPASAVGPTAGNEGGGGGTFTVAFMNEVDSFNPFLGIEAESYEMWALIYDSMTGYAMDDLSPVPALAKSWDSTEDGLTWTFDIRDDATWSDGEPLTAQDIAYTYNRMLEGKVEGASTWSSYLKSVTEVTAPDDTTVVMKLEKPNATLPLLPVPIVPEHVWSKVPLDPQQAKAYAAEPTGGEPVVGSGPFRLVEGTAGGSTYRFEANPDYWGGAPHIDDLVFRIFKSEDPAIQALIKGEVDFAYNISALQVESLQGKEGITAHNGNTPGFDEIAFNAGSVDLETGEPMGDPNPAVLDPAFRYALGFAVDRDLIVERAYQGAGTPGSSIIPPGYPDFHWEPSEDVAFEFDLEKAGQLLDEAGYTMGEDGKRTLPSGEPIGTLRLSARSESKSSVDVMDFLKEWLAELGIDSEVSAVESNRLTTQILDGEFDIFEWGWYVDPDPGSMLSYMTCDQRGDWSDTWYCNEEYDELYDAQSAELDRDKRAEMIKRMQEIVYMDAPYLLTVYNTIGEAARTDRFACFQPQPDPGGVWLIQLGVHNYLNVRPADEAGDCDGVTSAIGASASSDAADDDGAGNVLLIGGAVVLVLLVVGGAVVMVRRRATVGERE
jgi:peptide/nickel transport system substrate-binding protein